MTDVNVNQSPHDPDPVPVLDEDAPVYCTVHPDRETALRCNKCGRPMCVQCAVKTPVGYRCRECVRGQQDVFFTASNRDYVIAGVVSFVISMVASYVGNASPFFLLVLLGAAWPASGQSPDEARLAELEPRVHDLTGVLRREVGNRIRISVPTSSAGMSTEYCVQSSRRSRSPSEFLEWPGCRPVMLIVDGVTAWAPVTNQPEDMPQGQFRDILSMPPDLIEDVHLAVEPDRIGGADGILAGRDEPQPGRELILRAEHAQLV